MDRRTKCEVVATLIRANRRDLATQVVATRGVKTPYYKRRPKPNVPRSDDELFKQLTPAAKRILNDMHDYDSYKGGMGSPDGQALLGRLGLVVLTGGGDRLSLTDRGRRVAKKYRKQAVE